MDLVTITDHDSIDGCLELLDRLGEVPDFIVGEEVSAFFPRFQHTLHIGVYGISEAQHEDMQKLRANAEELLGYLRQQRVLFVLNHLFHDFANVARVREFVERMAELCGVFETLNGSMEQRHNRLISRLVETFRNGGRPVGMVAGSDAHTLRRVGRTFTASRARSREEFLADIRGGRTWVFGAHSHHLSLAADIYGVVLRYYPTVLAMNNGEFPPLIRLKNLCLSALAVPFLLVPYVVAVRHARVERERVDLFARLLAGNDG